MGFVAFVTGATGIQGSALLELLAKDDRFDKVYGVSRRKPEQAANKLTHLRMDLSNKEAVVTNIKSENIQDVTHVYHLVFTGDVTNVDSGPADMLQAIVEGLERNNSPLKHVYFSEGNKAYGAHFQAPKTPMDERDSRHIKPQFYYEMEDYVMRRKAEGAQWDWSTLRPPPIIGVNVGTTMSLLHEVAVYATFCKEEGIDLRFPGDFDTYHALFDVVDNREQMRAALWLSTHEEAANQWYNINNGDTFRWYQVWPTIAKWFGLEAGDPLPIPLSTIMPLKKDSWAQIQSKHGLKEVPYDKLAKWEFADATLKAGHDQFENTVKLRQAGYPGMVVDTPTMWREKLDEMAAAKLIPRYNKKGPLKNLLGKLLHAEE